MALGAFVCAPPIHSSHNAIEEISSFGAIVSETTGYDVLPFAENSDVDKAAVSVLTEAFLNLKRLFADPSFAAHSAERINEVSRHVEDGLRDYLEGHPDFDCQIPRTREGQIQRAGYPDLRLKHLASGRVYFLDPKLYRSDSERSQFRSFYFEPKSTTSKINEAGVHLVLGIEHFGKDEQSRWTLGGLKIVDVAGLPVRQKLEYHAGNRSLYAPERVVHSLP